MFLVFAVVALVVLPFYVVYKPPAILIRYFAHRWPDVLWQVPVSSKIVALTIDDAPSEYSLEVSKLLVENEASATFFVIGTQAVDNGQILEQVVKDGHELGNHAMHDQPSRSLSDVKLAEEILSVEDFIRKAYGEVTPPRYFRPGSGFFSERMRRNVAQLGYRLVLGGIYPHDPQISAWRLNARHILSMLQPGAIIICHDRRSWTLPMLRRVIPEIRRKGYRITTVTGLLESQR